MNLNILTKKKIKYKKEKFTLEQIIAKTFQQSFLEISTEKIYQKNIYLRNPFNLMGIDLEKKNRSIILKNEDLEIIIEKEKSEILNKNKNKKFLNFFYTEKYFVFIHPLKIEIEYLNDNNLKKNFKFKKFLDSNIFIKYVIDFKFENNTLYLIIRNSKNELQKIILNILENSVKVEDLFFIDIKKVMFFKDNYLILKRFDKKLFLKSGQILGLKKIENEKILDFVINEKRNLIILLLKNKLNLYKFEKKDSDLELKLLDSKIISYFLTNLELEQEYIKIKSKNRDSITLLIKITEGKESKNNYFLKKIFISNAKINILKQGNQTIINEIKNKKITQKLITSENLLIKKKNLFPIEKINLPEKEKEELKNLKEIIIKKNFGYNLYLLGEKYIFLLKYNKNLKNVQKIIPFIKKAKYIIYGGFETNNKKDFLILNYKLTDKLILNIIDIEKNISLPLSLRNPLNLYQYNKITKTLIFACGRIVIFLKIDEENVNNLLTLKNIFFDCEITDIQSRGKIVGDLNCKIVSDYVLFSDVKNSVHVYELDFDNEIKYVSGDFKGRFVSKVGWLDDFNFFGILENKSILFFSIIGKTFKVFKEKKQCFKEKESPLPLFENSLYSFFKMKLRFGILNFFLLDKCQIEEVLIDFKNSFLVENLHSISFAGFLVLNNGDVKLILNFSNLSHFKIKDDLSLKNLYIKNSLVKDNDENENVLCFDIVQNLN